MIFKILSSLLLSLLLVGCVSKPSKAPAPINDYVVIDPDAIPELRLNSVSWQAWNHARIIEESSKASNKDKVYFVLTQDQLGALLDNLISISDVFAKSVESNQYWQKSVDDYRAKKKAEGNK